MNMHRRIVLHAASAALSLIIIGSASAQPEKQPASPTPATKTADAAKRVGDPYPLDTCPMTGKKLGAMGDSITKVYDGREVRFCCPACPPKFEKDPAANLAKVDEKIIKDQAPLYPLKTSVVTGKDLPAKPYEFVYGNRLIRLGTESEKAGFTKDAAKHLAALDKAAVEQQGKDYTLKTCPVSKDELGGDMGKPVDVVVAGRLVRLCCDDCKKAVEKDPAKFIAMVDAARKGKAAAPDTDHKDKGK
ncbi:hypothetical protein BH11PLA1_BH11PLA1_12450 [soil metagenome]